MYAIEARAPMPAGKRERERACQPVGGERERERGKRQKSEYASRVIYATNVRKRGWECMIIYCDIYIYIYIQLVTPKDGTLKTILATYKTSIWGMHYVRHGKGCSLSSLSFGWVVNGKWATWTPLSGAPSPLQLGARQLRRPCHATWV